VAEGHRDALLTAARVLLRSKGLRATTARDLVAESGTNLASIGYHFGSKDALMAAALADVLREWTERPTAAGSVAAADGPGEALAAALRAMLADLPARRPEILAFAESVVAAGRDRSEDPSGIAAMLATSSRDALDAVAASMVTASPSLAPEAAAAAAAVVIALHDGLALLSTALPDRVPEPDVVIGVLIAFGAVLAQVAGMTPEQVAALNDPTA
jgi:AcrR family transcriptional regulator